MVEWCYCFSHSRRRNFSLRSYGVALTLPVRGQNEGYVQGVIISIEIPATQLHQLISIYVQPSHTTRTIPSIQTMKAYYYIEDQVGCTTFMPVSTSDAIQSDQREDHDSGHAVNTDYLSKLGVLYHRCPSVLLVDDIASERSYKNRDEIIVSPEKMGSLYEEKVKMFFNEHLHEDEEIRYILDGNGFFDVRNCNDKWIRIRLEKDDLIILPSGTVPVDSFLSPL